MYNDDRKAVSMWKFSDFYNAVEFITEGENFEQLVIGMATDAQGNLDRFFPTSVSYYIFVFLMAKKCTGVASEKKLVRRPIY